MVSLLLWTQESRWTQLIQQRYAVWCCGWSHFEEYGWCYDVSWPCSSFYSILLPQSFPCVLVSGPFHHPQEEDDYDVMQDPEFLQSVLENLPGVDPNNEAIRNAMGSLASQTGAKPPDSKKDDEKKKWSLDEQMWWGHLQAHISLIGKDNC